MNGTEYKICKCCGKSKSISLFHKKGICLTASCAECINVRDRLKRATNRTIIPITILPEEKWSPVLGYEGLYEISTHSRVKSIERTAYRSDGIYRYVPQILLKLNPNSDGYLMMILSKDGIQKNMCVHIMIAKIWVDNPNNHPEVNHIDGNKLNNLPTNLEWGTHRYNMQHAYKTGLVGILKGSNVHCAVINEMIAMKIFKSSDKGIDISKRYNVSTNIVSAIKTGKTWNHVTGLPNSRKK